MDKDEIEELQEALLREFLRGSKLGLQPMLFKASAAALSVWL
jgi:hypothetical protein